MKNTIYFSLAMLFASMLLLNCKGKQGDIGPSGPVLSGTLTGFISLTNSDGSQPLDKSGVIVKTNKGDSTVTATNGSWTLNEVTSVYSLTFSKPGYGMSKIFSYNFSGGGAGNLGFTYLSQTPLYTTTIKHATLPQKDTTNVTAAKDGAVNVNLSITSNGSNTKFAKEFLLFYSNNATVSSAPANYLNVKTISIPYSDTTYKEVINLTELNQAGIKSGDQLYIIVYPSSAAAAQSSRYIDITSGRNTYTSLGIPSNTFSYTVPN